MTSVHSNKSQKKKWYLKNLCNLNEILQFPSETPISPNQTSPMSSREILGVSWSVLKFPLWLGYEWISHNFPKEVPVNKKFMKLFGFIILMISLVSCAKKDSETSKSETQTFSKPGFVAVGNNGTIATSSSDATTWTLQSSGVNSTLFGVTYNNGLFVATGSSGTVLNSNDGINWTDHTSTSYTAHFFKDNAYLNNLYWAVNDNGSIFSSSDGKIWTSKYTGAIDGFYSITYGNNKYVTVGTSSGLLNIINSSDGINWTTVTNSINRYHLNQIIYAKNLFISVGYAGLIVTSSDSDNWVLQTSGTNQSLVSIVYGDNLFVAVGGSGTVITSSDGTSWESQTSITSNTLKGVTFGNGKYVAVGQSGTIISSSDGINWTSHSSGTTEEFKRVAYAE